MLIYRKIVNCAIDEKIKDIKNTSSADGDSKKTVDLERISVVSDTIFACAPVYIGQSTVL